jgi:ATP-dependent RNA helicase DeaD
MHPDRIASQADLLQTFRRAGYRSLTPLQERIIPLVLKGRDIAVQTPSGSGRTVAGVVALIVGVRGSSPVPAALAILATQAEVEDFSRTWTQFARVVRDAPALLPLGETDDVRREQRRLEKGGAVVVGTTDRVIDHIRRGSLSFDSLETVLIQAPDPADGTGAADTPPGGTWATPGEAREEFIRDAQFVFAKLSSHPQSVLFTREPLDSQGELVALLHRPALVSAADLETGGEEDGERQDVAVHLAGPRSVEVLAQVVAGRDLRSAVILHGPRTDGQALAAGLRRAFLRAEAVAGSAGPAARRRHVTAFAARELDVLVLPFPPGGVLPDADLDELRPTHVVYYDVPPVRQAQGQRPAGAGKGGSRGPSAVRLPARGVVVLAADGQEKELAKLQEAIGVSLNTGEVPDRDEVLGGAVRRILERLKSEADQADLARVRAAVRRSVPFFMRSWFAAYLLKSQLLPEQGGKDLAAPGRAPREAGQRPLGRPTDRPQGRPAAGQQGRPAERPLGRPAERPQGRPAERPLGRPTDRPLDRPAERPQAPRGQRQPRAERPRPEAQRPSDGAEWTQLFVNIGRNRRVFAADISTLFASTLQLSPAEIGDVRVFDKYSFVDIVPARAADAIARLTGAELKGRPITVNYAKKKEEKEAR